jgi:fructose-bisphosphate aldolase class II/tagatose 1,6-diphosphate aldolase GatY/KbaY
MEEGEARMSSMAVAEAVRKAYREGYAVPAFCAWNAEVMRVILRTAARLRAPVILMHSRFEFSLLPPALMAEVGRVVAGSCGVPALLHLDHGDSPELVRECLAAGYPSVMLDYSARPFAENAEALREVAALARPLGVCVEGEIGRVGKAGESAAEGGSSSTLTDPREAAQYVRRSRVDLLAVSVGNQHGFYRGEPRIEFGLLAELRAAAEVPLVLHGGTGIPEKDIRRSVQLGIAKVNVASELVHGFRSAFDAQWAGGANPWLSSALGAAVAGLEKTVEKWIRITGAEGRA